MFRKQDTKIHFVGIGGMGMCGIAEVLANMGYRVSGSDMNDTEITRHLTNIGCAVLPAVRYSIKQKSRGQSLCCPGTTRGLGSLRSEIGHAGL